MNPNKKPPYSKSNFVNGIPWLSKNLTTSEEYFFLFLIWSFNTSICPPILPVATWIFSGSNEATFLFLIGIILGLVSGPVISTALQENLNWLGGATGGTILFLLYFSPIKDKFIKQ